MPTEPSPPSVFEVVRRAVEVCDPAGESPETADLLERFEDRDEPVTALADPEADLAQDAVLDEGMATPVELMVMAVATYLAHRRDEIGDAPQDLLRLTARAEWDGDPPGAVRDWLAEQGVEV